MHASPLFCTCLHASCNLFCLVSDWSCTADHAPTCVPQIVHFMADWGARRQMRKGGGGGCSHSHNSTTNLLTHEDQRNARSTRGGAAPADSPPAVASMRKSGALPGSAAVAAGGTPRAGGTPAPDAAAKRGASAAALEAGTADGDGDGDDSCSVSTHACELSAPVGSLTEPCDAMTTAVVAASCPDTMAAQADGQRGDGGGGGEVRALSL